MKFTNFMTALWASSICSGSHIHRRQDDGSLEGVQSSQLVPRDHKITPKVFIITMVPHLPPFLPHTPLTPLRFQPETDAWLHNSALPGSFGPLTKTIPLPGLSPLYPSILCTPITTICLLTTGEAEINAAASTTALLLSPLFDLRQTYFLLSGIAGVNPDHGTLADVAFAKYAVQVALQYEIDGREVPGGWSSGYIPQGSHVPDEYPGSIYGTEVFEINEALRDIAVKFAGTAKLNDSAISSNYRQHYASYGNDTKTGLIPGTTRKPRVISCDVVTSDVYFSGTLLAESFEKTTKLFTNGSGEYCMTAQEDNAILGSMLRAAKAKTMDFGRIIVMRSGANFDRPATNMSCLDNLFYVPQGAFQTSIDNLYLAGAPVVNGILKGWKDTFEAGVQPRNYVGDIFGSLGGTPDFGPGRAWNNNPVQQRGLTGKVMARDSVAGNPDGKGKRGAMVARGANGNGDGET
jgi:purine nucleoside permease